MAKMVKMTKKIGDSPEDIDLEFIEKYGTKFYSGQLRNAYTFTAIPVVEGDKTKGVLIFVPYGASADIIVNEVVEEV